MKITAIRHIIYNASLTRMKPDAAAITIATPAEAAIAQEKARIASSMDPARGRLLWRALHLWALALNGRKDWAWLTAFDTSLPCGSCRAHWRQIVAENPPDWTNPFAWTVARHNQVNARLDKPQLTEAEARAIWSLPVTPKTPLNPP